MSQPSTPPALYECPDCGERTTERRCPDCHLFTRRLGPGGHGPSCEELILVTELLPEDQGTEPSHTKILTSSSTTSVRCGLTPPELGSAPASSAVRQTCTSASA